MLLFLALLFAGDSSMLIKEIRHGNDPDGITWGVGTNCAITQDGTLYVVDPNAFKVRMLSPSFEPVGAFGRKGKGPGEFEELKSIAVTPDGHLGVFDPALKRLSLFSPKGELLKTLRMESNIVGAYTPVFLSGGEAAFVAPKSADGKPVYDLSLYDADMKPIRSFNRIEMPPLDWTQSQEPSFWVTFLKDRLELLGRGVPIVTALDGTTLAVARSDTATVHYFDPSGKQLASFSFDLARKAFSTDNRMAAFREVWSRLSSDPFLAMRMPEAIFQKAADEAQVPEVLPLVRAMVPLAGGLAVLTNFEDHKRTGRWKLFSRDGQLVAETDYTGPASFFTSQGKVLIAVGLDEEEDIVIDRLRWQGPTVSKKE